MLKQYVRDLYETAKTGDAREESFYQDLATLLETYSSQNDLDGLHVTTLPKQTEAGNPDFRVWDGQQEITGYIEAKKPSNSNLNKVAKSEQLKRYRETFPNLILTNFLQFRLYKDGELEEQVNITPLSNLAQQSKPPSVKNEEEFLDLLDRFFSFSVPKTYTAKSLAVELAKRTKFLRDDILEEELKGETPEAETLQGYHEAFQEYLIGGISREEFADLYAQTITYGLFAARTRSDEGFDRESAYELIPPTIGILRDMFEFISGRKSAQHLSKQLQWIVDDISQTLAAAEVKQILHKYYHEGKGTDPIIHFYETFLSEYDPETRERRGVYYTPEPIVSYITESVNEILSDKFNKEDGFANSDVKVLDPAAGTLTFIAKAAQLAVGEFTEKYGEGAKQGLIQDHILEDYYAFELMMAPYAVGHLKISFLLEEMGYSLSKQERFNLYLTNTLEMEELEKSKLPLMREMSKESHMASEVKRDTPILAIIGNPPYSGISSNKGDWITELIEDYKYVEGEHFNEKKHWLQDDYVKFLRFAQWKIEQSGHGVVGMITNHSWLDNPTFRGMRWQLLQTFDEIRVLDLHGNSLKRETTPEGSKDENVFDIRQGVGIWFFIKQRNSSDEPASVYHSDKWGLEEDKYDWLEEHDVTDTEWTEITPKSDFYLYIPRDEAALDRYKSFPKVTEIFKTDVTGIITSRDRFVVHHDREGLLRRISEFRDLDISDDVIRERYGLNDTRGWKLTNQRQRLSEIKNWKQYATSYLYRPFDIRWIYYHPDMVDWPRQSVMRHMMEENIALCVGRQWDVVGSSIYDIIAITDTLTDFNLFRRGGELVFPLHLYPNSESDNLFNQDNAMDERESNIRSKVLQRISKTYGTTIKPDKLLFYIYGVLNSITYRKKYSSLLKKDYPRIPITNKQDLLNKISKLGKKLVNLQLLKFKELEQLAARFQGKGSNKIAKAKRVGRNYKPEEQRVYINKDGQFFEGIKSEVWEYQIGGYQVLDKWLKGRRERKLTPDEVKTYCKIVTAIQQTIKLQQKIDESYPAIEENTIDLELERN